MSNFQLGLLSFFGIIIVIAVVLFAGYAPGGGTGVDKAILTMWGPFPADSVNDYVDGFNANYSDYFELSYREVDPASMDATLVEALASGRGPDLVIYPHDLYVRMRNKLALIPYPVVSERNVLDQFADGAQMFLEPGGVASLPIASDPLVLYWNKDLFNDAGIPTPPKTWDDVVAAVSKLSVRQKSGTGIEQSAIALGGYKNISHAKDIVSALLLQVGDSIVGRGEIVPGDALSPLRATLSETKLPDASGKALQFYADFADPAKSAYSWNRSLPNSRDQFVAGDLAMYLAPASEASNIRRRAPHLNFDTAILPQLAGDALPDVTFARIYAIGVLAQSQNRAGATSLAQLITSSGNASQFLARVGYSPYRRDLLASINSQNPLAEVAQRSALIGRAWRDPLPQTTDAIFSRMVEAVTVGRQSAGDAVSSAQTELSELIP